MTCQEYGRNRRGEIEMFVTKLCARATVLAFVAMLVSCASAPDTGRVGPQDIRLEVDNGNYLDVVVFGLQDHTTTRIGSVTGLSSATFLIPDRLLVLGRIRILVDPVGSPVAYLTDEIMVNPGDVVELYVAGVIRMSSWSVRSGGGGS